MGWITVPIVCIADDVEADELRKANEQLERLDLPVRELPEPQIEIRKGRMNTNHIIVYYPANDPERTIVECGTKHYSIALPLADFMTLAEKDNG
jgi:hypothetical protein